MRQELLMPKLGLTMTEGTVAEWVVAPGAFFRAGQTILLIETDKVAVEYPAESDGKLLEVTAKVGDLVSVGSVIGYIEVDGTGLGAVSPATAPVSNAATPVAALSTVAVRSQAPSKPARFSEGRIIATPLARRMASNLSFDLSRLTGTGPRGRIRADDVRSAAAKGQEAVAALQTAPAVLSARVSVQGYEIAGQLLKPTSIQATMARRLTAAKQEIPHFYLAAEAEVTRLLAVRAEINASKPRVRLTLNHLVIAAVARALSAIPSANQVWTDEGIRVFDSVDVGVAVDTEQGLMVPVVRAIGEASLPEIGARCSDVVDRARQGRLKQDDIGGGAITVSNAGMHEVTWMTPIINPGTAMILGVGSIRDVFRPDSEGRPALRREMGLVLAADHRLVDGVAGLTFLNRVIEHLRNPFSLL